MEFVQLTPQQSDNLVNDLAFDFYGRRFASCSVDGKLRVWDLNEEDNTWNSVEVEAHSQSIWRISWAHPEYGNLIATCSEDRSVCIWEEQVSITQSAANDSKEHWIKKATLTDSKKPVNDVKFAPKHLGLKFATASADGMVRIYEATDVFSLHFWQLQYSFAVEDTSATSSSSSTYTSLSSTRNNAGSSNKSDHGVVSLAWSDSVFEPARLCVGGYGRKAVIWVFDEGISGPNKWKEECELDPKGYNNNSSGTGASTSTGVGASNALSSSLSNPTTNTTGPSTTVSPLHSSGVVHDIAWAPAMGRSYHLIATASRENNFKIHTLIRRSDGSIEYSSTHTEQVATPVWRVSWNATGTVLATSAEDGSLNLWRKDFAGTWKNVQELPNLETTKQIMNTSADNISTNSD